MLWNNDINTAMGPHKVLLKRGEFVDDARAGRVVPYKIYYPDAPDLKKVPVILWSHGFGGSRDGAAFLARYVASYGYILVHITHEGTDSSLWEGKPGHPWDILRETKVPRDTTMARFLDVPFALDALKDWARDNPDIGAMMDFDALGMSGHSFGAITTQVAAGQLTLDENDAPVSLREPRFKAGILYSPVPVADHLLAKAMDLGDANIYASIAIPLLHMTGTQDSAPIGDAPYEHRLAVYEQTMHPEKYLLVKEGGDHMVYNGTRGKLGNSDLRERHEELVRVISLAFWEAQLKGDEKAQEWLSGGGITPYIFGDAEFKAST